jgi:hypothetical protein
MAHRGQRLALRAHMHQPLKIPPGEKRVDDAGIVILVVPEVDQFAVGQEDEGGADLLGVRQRLLLCDIGLNGLPLGFDDGQRPAALVQQDIIGAPGRHHASPSSVVERTVALRIGLGYVESTPPVTLTSVSTCDLSAGFQPAARN